MLYSFFIRKKYNFKKQKLTKNQEDITGLVKHLVYKYDSVI